MYETRERGMVTVETAIVIPVLMALTLILVWVVSLGIAQVRLVDAAREAARMSARGDSESKVESMAERVAPDGSEVEIERSDGLTRVHVDLRVFGDLPLVGDIGAIDLHAAAASATEADAG